jgi:membrane-associated HD superfamily phosphohydrolase
MLADSIEAASRTLEDPSHLRFKDLVEKLIRKKSIDEQLPTPNT